MSEIHGLMCEDVRLVALGDSIVHGHMVPDHRAWPSVLLTLLRDHSPQVPWSVINSGVCGETAVQGLQRLERDALRHHPDVLFIAFGLNDCFLAQSATDVWRVAQALPEVANGPLGRLRAYHAVRRRLGVPKGHTTAQDSGPQPRIEQRAFIGAMEKMMAAARNTSVPHVYLMTMTPVSDQAHAYWAAELRERQLSVYDQYNRAIRATALATSTKLIDVEAGMSVSKDGLSEYLDFDGVHLTSTGQEALARIVFRELELDGTLDSLARGETTCDKGVM